MREQAWIWVCELCGHRWLASGVDAPAKCAKCKRRGWHTKAVHVADEPRHGPLPQAEPTIQAVVNPLSAKLSLLASIPGLKTGATLDDSPIVPFRDIESDHAEVPICLFDWWEDGEHYECLMDKGHKSPKHGQHGAVCKVDG